MQPWNGESGALLRHRKAYQGIGLVNVGLAQPECAPRPQGRLGLYPATVFVLAYLLFIATGFVCLFTPPLARATAAGEDVPSDSSCYRVVRKADYTAVEYAMGAPTRRVMVLLRLDKVVGDADNSVRIFNSRVVESKTFSCEPQNATCYDVLLATQGDPNAHLANTLLEFDYTSPLVEGGRYDVAKYRLGLAGEMFAAKGYRYYLTNTHLCVSRNLNVTLADTTGALEAHVRESDGKLESNITSVASLDVLSSSALHGAYHDSQCLDTLRMVDVFPYESGAEVVYLALTDTNLYETEPDAVSTRRHIVELGAVCASTLDDYSRAYNLYDIDCSNAYATCRETPSLPFRRVSTLGIRAQYTTDGKAYFWFAEDHTLRALTGMANSYDAIVLSIVKLLLMVLAAAVMWVRSDRVTSSSHWLYRHCIQIANCLPFSVKGVQSSVVEDAFLGFVALSARFAVALWRLDSLSHDGQTRVCLFETVAALVSLANWIVRYWVIEPHLIELIDNNSDGKGPLTRLGGSMAIADASSAVLIAFAEPPLLLSAISRFDNTARLLTGLLISLVTLHRCLFACCCNAIIYEADVRGRLVSSPAYKTLLISAGMSWAFQTMALGVSMADLVATPMAYALGRGIVGEKSAVGLALFLTFVCASLPRLMHTCVRLMGDDQKPTVDE